MGYTTGGFYWVKFTDGWEVARYCGNDNWALCGSDPRYKTRHLNVVGPQIPPPAVHQHGLEE